jgi:peptidoglycan hydrolase CwlO-like protein
MSKDTFITAIKENLPKQFGVVAAVIMAGFSLASNYASNNTHLQDLQKDQERRIELLEKDSATRREMDEVKKTVDRIESKLDHYREEELKYHHGK